MKVASSLPLWVVSVVIASSGASWAQPPAAVDKERQKRLEQQFQESMGWYRLTAGPDSAAALKPQAVLRWTNATRGQEGEPTLLFWTGNGRPEALSSVYMWQGNLIYECVSLARDPGLTAREGGRVAWSPAEVGAKFLEVPDAPTPAATAVGRLLQMKAIAERFKVTMTGMKSDLSDREEMRLLPKPIYRYELAAATAAHPDLVDGAAFAFVQGTDPEAVLLVEAVRKGDRKAWQYAFGRATSAGLEARLGPTLVWTTPRQTSWGDPKLTSIGMGRRLVD